MHPCLCTCLHGLWPSLSSAWSIARHSTCLTCPHLAATPGCRHASHRRRIEADCAEMAREGRLLAWALHPWQQGIGGDTPSTRELQMDRMPKRWQRARGARSLHAPPGTGRAHSGACQPPGGPLRSHGAPWGCAVLPVCGHLQQAVRVQHGHCSRLAGLAWAGVPCGGDAPARTPGPAVTRQPHRTARAMDAPPDLWSHPGRARCSRSTPGQRGRCRTPSRRHPTRS